MIVRDENGIEYKVLKSRDKNCFWVEMIPCSMLCTECNEADEKLNLFGVCGECEDKLNEGV